MPALNLTKGSAGVQLRGDYKFNILMIGAGWDERKTPGPDIDVDPIVILRDAAGKANQDDATWCCFYNNPDTGWCRHSGDNRTGAGQLDATGDDERMWIDLAKIPLTAMSVDFVVNIFEAAQNGLSFGDLTTGKLRLVNVPKMGEVSGDEKIVINLAADEYFSATGFLAFTLVRNGVAWEVKRMDLTDARWAHTEASWEATNKVEPTK